MLNANSKFILSNINSEKSSGAILNAIKNNNILSEDKNISISILLSKINEFSCNFTNSDKAQISDALYNNYFIDSKKTDISRFKDMSKVILVNESSNEIKEKLIDKVEVLENEMRIKRNIKTLEEHFSIKENASSMKTKIDKDKYIEECVDNIYHHYKNKVDDVSDIYNIIIESLPIMLKEFNKDDVLSIIEEYFIFDVFKYNTQDIRNINKLYEDGVIKEEVYHLHNLIIKNDLKDVNFLFNKNINLNLNSESLEFIIDNLLMYLYNEEYDKVDEYINKLENKKSIMCMKNISYIFRCLNKIKLNKENEKYIFIIIDMIINQSLEINKLPYYKDILNLVYNLSYKKENTSKEFISTLSKYKDTLQERIEKLSQPIMVNESLLFDEPDAVYNQKEWRKGKDTNILYIVGYEGSNYKEIANRISKAKGGEPIVINTDDFNILLRYRGNFTKPNDKSYSYMYAEYFYNEILTQDKYKSYDDGRKLGLYISFLHYIVSQRPQNMYIFTGYILMYHLEEYKNKPVIICGLSYLKSVLNMNNYSTMFNKNFNAGFMDKLIYFIKNSKSYKNNYKLDKPFIDNYKNAMKNLDIKPDKLSKLIDESNIEEYIFSREELTEMTFGIEESYILDEAGGIGRQLHLAKEKIRRAVETGVAKDRAISNQLDTAVDNIINGIRDAAASKEKERIIKGKILPPLSTMIKIACASGLLWAIDPVLPIIGAVTGLALAKNTNRKQKQMLLDEISVHLKIVEKQINQAEMRGDTKKIENLMKLELRLKREYQRIKYNMRVTYNPDIK